MSPYVTQSGNRRRACVESEFTNHFIFSLIVLFKREIVQQYSRNKVEKMRGDWVFGFYHRRTCGYLTPTFSVGPLG